MSVRPGRARLACVLATAVVAAELFVRLGEPMYRWTCPESDDYAAAVWRARSAPVVAGRPAFALVGNSAVRENLDEETLGRRLGMNAYNWGLSAEPVDGLAMMELPPGGGGVLVIGMNPNMLEARTAFDARYPWRRSGRESWLILYRSELAGVLQSRVRRLFTDDLVLTGRASKERRYSEPQAPEELEETLARIESVREMKPRLDDEQSLAALEALVRRGERSGYQVRALWMPARRGVPAFALETERSRRARALLKRLGVPQYEAPADLLDEEDFYDYHHLLASGRAKLTDFLARALGAGA